MTGFTSKRQMAQDKEALAQPAQGPVDNDFFKNLGKKNPSPDQRPWVGLTDEELYETVRAGSRVTKADAWHIVENLKTKLKEKNT